MPSAAKHGGARLEVSAARRHALSPTLYSLFLETEISHVDELSALLARVSPLNRSGWTDVLCWPARSRS